MTKDQPLYYQHIKANNNKTEYKIKLSFNSKSQHIVQLEGILEGSENLYIFSNFDDQVKNGNFDKLLKCNKYDECQNDLVHTIIEIEKVDFQKKYKNIDVFEKCLFFSEHINNIINRSYNKINYNDKDPENFCSYYSNCTCKRPTCCYSSKSKLNHLQTVVKTFEEHHDSSLNLETRCDDIVIYNQCMYFFELKNEYTIPDCHAFSKFTASKKLVWGKSSIFPKNVVNFKNLNSKFILCATPSVVSGLHSVLTFKKGLLKVYFFLQKSNIFSMQDKIIKN